MTAEDIPVEPCFNKLCFQHLDPAKQEEIIGAQLNEASCADGSISASHQGAAKLIDIERIKVTLNSNKEEVSFCKYCYSCYMEGNKCDYCDQIYASNVGDAQIQ